MERFGVVVCPNCEAVRVVDLTSKTTVCNRCGKQKKMKKLRTFVETDSQEKARLVAGEVRAKQQGEEESFIEAFESGELDTSSYEGVTGAYDWVYEDSEESENRSDKQIVLDVIQSLDQPNKANIVKKASEYGVSSDSVETILERLQRQSEVLVQSDGTYRIL